MQIERKVDITYAKIAVSFDGPINEQTLKAPNDHKQRLDHRQG